MTNVLNKKAAAALPRPRGSERKSPFKGEVGEPVNFDNLDGQTRLNIINEILSSEDVRRATQRRNVSIYECMRTGNRDSSALMRYEVADRMVAELIGYNFIVGALRNPTASKAYGARRLFDGIDVSNPAIAEMKKRCVWNMDATMFVADIMEMYLSSINDCLAKMFPGQGMRFEMFDDVMLLLKRLRLVFGKTRDRGDLKQQELFAMYAESINSYMDKRVNAFIHKSEAIKKKTARANDGNSKK